MGNRQSYRGGAIRCGIVQDICCGGIIPEGRQVCPICERQWPEF